MSPSPAAMWSAAAKRRRAGWFGAAVALCAVSLAGCGSAPTQDAAPPVPATTAQAGAAIVIAGPPDGSRLRARSRGGMLRLATRVHGSARVGSAIFVRAGCRPRPCSARATAGPDGRWAVRMTLTTLPASPFVTIDVTAGRSSAAPGAVTTIEAVSRARAPAAPGAGRGGAAERPPRAAQPPPPAPPLAPADPSPPASTEPAPRSQPLPHEVLVIGDSLAIGMADSLRAALAGWQVRVDARIGRPLAEGMRILAAQRDAPAIVALSLFTNDDPRATAQLARAVRASATRPGGCAVWATVARPPYQGVSYAAANDVLERLAGDRQLAGDLRLVDWRSLVARVPSYIAGDGVHGTPAGYRARGRLYADAIRACAGED